MPSFLVAAVMAGPLLPSASAQQWAELGAGISAHGGVNIRPAIAGGPSGQVTVAWLYRDPIRVTATSYAPVHALHLRRWNPAARDWEELGGSATGDGLGPAAEDTPSIAVTAGGDPVVAWTFKDSSTPYGTSIRLRRWNGASGAWEGLGGSDAAGGLSGPSYGLIAAAGQPIEILSPSLALGPADAPAVAYSVNFQMAGLLGPVALNIAEIHFRRWNPATAAWEDLGGSGTGEGISHSRFLGVIGEGGNSGQPQLALDAAGNPAIGWTLVEFMTSNGFAYLRRWNPLAGAWTELGGSATGQGIEDLGGAGSANLRSLRMDPAGNPVVADVVSTAGSLATLIRRWTPDTGTWLLEGSFPGVFAACPALDASGNPLVSFTELGEWVDAQAGDASTFKGRMRVLRSTGAWNELVAPITSEGIVPVDSVMGASGMFPAALALDSKGAPVVAWLDGASGAPLVRVSAWSDPRTFEDLAQLRDDGVTPLNPGGTIVSGSILLSGRAYGRGRPFRLQVEVAEVGSAFDGTPSATSPEGPAGSTPRIQLPVPDGVYHWRARTMDDLGAFSPWISFGSGGEGETDFIASATGTPLDDDGTSAARSCLGAAGARVALAALLALGLLALRT